MQQQPRYPVFIILKIISAGLLVSVSTPTVEDESKIESRYQQSDQRKFYVPCPECDTFQVLSWQQVKFEKGKPDTTHYACEHCETKLKESDKM